MSIVRVYVDGSWKPKVPDFAGWAYILIGENDEIIHVDKGVVETFSRQVDGELVSTINALNYIHNNMRTISKIELYYDYTGIESWATGKWKARSDIAKFYIEELSKIPEIVSKIIYIKVKSHNGESIGNELADSLAQSAIDNFLRD